MRSRKNALATEVARASRVHSPALTWLSLAGLLASRARRRFAKQVVFSDVDRQVFEALVPADHFLRRVDQAVDFPAFRPLLESGYSPDHGRPADEPVRLLKLCYLQFQFHLSDREVIARTGTDVAFRWFLGLGLTDAPPDASTLCVFRGRLEDPQGLALDADVPPKTEPATDKFVPQDFSEDADRSHVTCPAGQTSHYRQREPHATVDRFAQATCAACPLLRRCVSGTLQSLFGRTIRKSDYTASVENITDVRENHTARRPKSTPHQNFFSSVRWRSGKHRTDGRTRYYLP